jgi:hypothetical protein
MPSRPPHHRGKLADHRGHRGIRQFVGHRGHFNRAILRITQFESHGTGMSSATADTINAYLLPFIKA